MENDVLFASKVANLRRLYQEGSYSDLLKMAVRDREVISNDVEALNLTGLAHGALGQLDNAITAFQRAIELEPNRYDLFNNFGTVLIDNGNVLHAEKLFKRAISIRRDYPEGWTNLGNSLKKQSQLGNAIAAYKFALSVDSKFVPALINIGLAFAEDQQFEFAENALASAVEQKPNDPRCLNNLGMVLLKQDKLDESAQAFEKALEINPNDTEIQLQLGNIYFRSGKRQVAAKFFEKILSKEPDRLDVLITLGMAHQLSGDLDMAAETYQAAIAINPSDPLAYNNLGTVFQKLGDFESARRAFETAIEVDTEYLDAFFNLGLLLKKTGYFEAAITCLKKFISGNPEHIEALCTLGNCLRELGDFTAAGLILDQALALDNHSAEAKCNKALLLLTQGDFEKGLFLYESRKTIGFPVVSPADPKRAWDGQASLNGKMILVIEEQGLGDIIQFARYISLLEIAGANITFQVQKKLHKLLGSLKCNVRLVHERPLNLDYDFEIALLSLPFLFNTTLKSIPQQLEYLYACPKKIAFWNKKFSKKFKIGICWQGSKSEIDYGRSFPLYYFEDLASLPNVELINLHKGAGEKQLAGISFKVTSLGDEFDGGSDALVDTAAVMSICDLIITSDTVIAHLAGALGRHTWVLLKSVPDWRWMLETNKTYWYPSVVLYRQRERGDWHSVFAKIKTDLSNYLEMRGLLE